VPDRRVRFTEQFFNRLDSLLAEERSASGEPSVTDFIVHELPRIRDGLAEDFEANTMGTPDPEVRAYMAGGVLFSSIAVYTAIDDDGDIHAFWLSIDRNMSSDDKTDEDLVGPPD
jgi:hypothetical protein